MAHPSAMELLVPWGKPIHTVFIQTLAVATINFNLARVRLLIEGGSYSRMVFINFGAIPLGDNDTIDSFLGLIFVR